MSNLIEDANKEFGKPHDLDETKNILRFVIERSELINLKKKVHSSTGFVFETKRDDGNNSIDMRYSAVDQEYYKIG